MESLVSSSAAIDVSVPSKAIVIPPTSPGMAAKARVAEVMTVTEGAIVGASAGISGSVDVSAWTEDGLIEIRAQMSSDGLDVAGKEFMDACGR